MRTSFTIIHVPACVYDIFGDRRKKIFFKYDPRSQKTLLKSWSGNVVFEKKNTKFLHVFFILKKRFRMP